MQVREAKDFLVQQTAEQASLEGVPLSDLEKRMMYFTESGYVPEDPIKLNDEFEAEYNTAEYEAKIRRLTHDAELLDHALLRFIERKGKGDEESSSVTVILAVSRIRVR